MKVWGITDRGNVRRQNQDVFYHWSDEQTVFAVVCDGMGGARSGNVASALACQRFVETASAEEALPPERFQRSLEIANAAVRERSLSDPACRGMGTTMVAVFAKDDLAYILNVGDSRCYHISGGLINQVTKDHSLVEELVELGHITREEAREHPHKNIITRALGTDDDVEGDLFEEPLDPGDLLVLCSDGLSNEVPDESIKDICLNSAPEERCGALLAAAKAAGAHDNVTVVILESAGGQEL